MTREELRRRYDTEFAPRLEALEEQRIRRRRSKAGLWLTGLFAIPVAFVISKLGWSLEASAFAMIVVIVPAAYACARLAFQASDRHAALFAQLVGDVLHAVLPGASYSPAGSAAVGGAVQGSGLFNARAERCGCLAAVTGALRPAGLLLADVRLYSERLEIDETRSHRPLAERKRRRETTVFRGLFLAFDLDAPVAGTSFVDTLHVGRGIADRDALDRMSLEDREFDKLFRVSASDVEEARLLLTPSVRAVLTELRASTKRPIHFSIAEERASLAVEFGRPLFLSSGGAVTFEQVAELADAFALPELLSAALPRLPGRARSGVVGPSVGAQAGQAPGRPATSATRVSRNTGGVSIVYTRAVSRLALVLSALATPLLLWFWFLALSALLASGDRTGVFAALIPLSTASVFWLFAAQAWWGPVRRVDVDDDELHIGRGLLRKQRVAAASIRVLAIRDGVLYADALALSPALAGAELRWLAYELGRALPSARPPER